MGKERDLYAPKRRKCENYCTQHNKGVYKNKEIAQFICPCIKKDANEAPKMTNKVRGNELTDRSALLRIKKMVSPHSRNHASLRRGACYSLTKFLALHVNRRSEFLE